MKEYLLFLLLVGSIPALPAYAKDPFQENATQENATKDKIDEVITNTQLRAQLGSKSKWSFKSRLGYNGGPISNAFGRTSFNDKAKNDLTSFVGRIGLNHRVNESDSLSADINAKMKNPAIEWNRAYNLANLQAITSVNYSHVTDQATIDDLAALGSIGFKHTILAVLEESGWSVGASLFLNYFLYSGPRSAKAKNQNLPQQDFGYELSPLAEYSFNDTYSFKTVLAYINLVHYQTRGVLAEGAVQAQVPYQSIGVGISAHRDIFLYPSIQFNPFNVRSDRTAIALNTNINLSLF